MSLKKKIVEERDQKLTGRDEGRKSNKLGGEGTKINQIERHDL